MCVWPLEGDGLSLLSGGDTKRVLASASAAYRGCLCSCQQLGAALALPALSGLAAAPVTASLLLIMVCCGAFGNTALGRPGSVEHRQGFGSPPTQGSRSAQRLEK